MNIVKEKWSEIIEKLRGEYGLSNVSFNTWIKPLKVHEVKDNTVFLLCELKASIDHIKHKYELPLRVCIAEVTDEEFNVAFICEDDIKQTETKEENQKIKTIIEQANLNHKYTFDTFVVGQQQPVCPCRFSGCCRIPG